jgi:hypothetical protein
MLAEGHRTCVSVLLAFLLFYDEVTKETPCPSRSLCARVPYPSEEFRRAKIVCLLPAQPAALLSCLTDESPRHSTTKSAIRPRLIWSHFT